jgi:tungstate transport system substrate-binding protein
MFTPGAWYRALGSGMGATLNAGIGMGAYVMTDRATWISFGNKQDYAVQVQGDPELFNQYGVIPINPAVCSNVDLASAQVFADWLTGPDGQAAIAAYSIDGQQLFFPNAPGQGS